MATTTGTSGLVKPWAWLAAVAVFGLVLASSTAIYVVNPSVKQPLPWWAAVAAPLVVYALVLPLCVPRLRLGGWLVGLLVLAVLHVIIALSTAWLYATVGFTSFEQALPPALWGFPPALVLAMVGSLVMTLPFLGALAPRAPRPEKASAPPRPAAAKKQSPPADSIPAKDRQAWARGPAGAEPAAVAEAVSTLPEPAFVAPTVEAPAPALEEYSSPVDRQSPAIPHQTEMAPDEPAVHAAPLLGVNGGGAPEALEADAPAAVPDFRQALSELFGTPQAASRADEVLEAPEERMAPDELVAPEPSVTPSAPEPSVAEVAEAPVESEAMVRIPFERVMGQLPPGAFRVPLGQVGARLREAEMLVVPQALIVPQLGEGVVQVAWEVVAEQFPAAVFAVAPGEVGERIVNGRLFLPLDEIVRQLPPDVFAASIGRGPVEVPGIEGFPAPFKPPGWEETPASAVVSRRGPEPMSIEVPDAAEVARDLALTPPEPEARMPEVSLDEIEPVPLPTAPELAAASLLEEARSVEPVELPQNVVEIEEVSEVLDLDSLLESTPAQVAPEAGRDTAALDVVRYEQAPDELVAPEPSVAEVAEAPVESEAMVRIPFERVMGQLPPGAFRVPLGQVGARLREAEMLVVPQALIVPQLGEGVVQVAWEVVAEQFPAAVFAVAPGEVGERIVNGRLFLPLDEIVRQLPPDVFAASIGRGPVEVPGIEGFPAPFKPLGPLSHDAPPEPAIAKSPIAPVSAPSAPPPIAAEPLPVLGSMPERAPELVAEPVSELVAEPVAERVAEHALEPVFERALAEPVFAVPTLEKLPPPAPQPARIEPRAKAEKLAALLIPWDTAALDEAQVGDFAIISVSAAGLAGGAVAAAAGRLSPVIARRAPRPVEQATLRGVGGTLVLTPVGSGWNTGTALAVGLRPGGPLARLEMLARRAARAHESSAQGPRTHDATPAATLATVPPHAAAAAAVEDLEAFGPLTSQSYREPTSGVVVHCFVPSGAPAALVATFAWELAQAMAQGAQAGPLSSFQSAVLRSGTERYEIRRLRSATGPAPVLVVGGADTGRPGLARLQVERAAARLGAA